MTDLRNPPLETSDLKPCPFCGERLCLSEFLSTRSVKYFIHEPNGCLIQSTTVPVSERDSSRVENWNRRALPLPLEEQTEGEVIAYASSKDYRKNHLMSAAQYKSALPKNRVDFDIPLVAAPSSTSGGGE